MRTRSTALAMAGLLCIANVATRDDNGPPTTYVFVDGTDAFRFQANYLLTHARRNGDAPDPNILELHAQLQL